MSGYKIPELGREKLREFGLVVGGVFAGLFGLLLPWLFSYDFPIWPWIVLVILSVWAIVAPVILNPVYKIWMRFGLAIGWVMNRVVLSVVFFAIFVPVGWVMRAFGNDPMKRRIDATRKSYRIECDAEKSRKMDRPF